MTAPKNILVNVFIMFLMMASAVIAFVAKPSIQIADLRSNVDLELLIPIEFGDWKTAAQPTTSFINPQQAAVLSIIYTQTLSRAYSNSAGDRIMLSIAYGKNQSDGVTLHYPEVCYPAQGFTVESKKIGLIATDFGDIRVKQLTTYLGNRYEPVTYWTTLGNEVTLGGLETKIAQIKYGITGKIPDGLVFRVSSITRDSNRGFQSQADFSRALVAALTADNRLMLAGLKEKKAEN